MITEYKLGKLGLQYGFGRNFDLVENIFFTTKVLDYRHILQTNLPFCMFDIKVVDHIWFMCKSGSLGRQSEQEVTSSRPPNFFPNWTKL